MDPKEGTDTSPEGGKEPIRFTCHVCHVSTTGTLHALGAHLREMHRVHEESVEISEEDSVIQEEATHVVLATWQELTQRKEQSEDVVTDQ